MKKLGWRYLELALWAFAGLGAEALLAFGLEPMLYGCSMEMWNTGQAVAHWVMTCAVWGAVVAALVKGAKKKMCFDLLQKGAKMSAARWTLVGLCLAFSLAVSYLDWNGFKVVREFRANGWLKFIFQYVYYAFETGLVTLIIIFGQKAFESWFGNEKIPYGGILAALTWGLAHILTKGSLPAGLVSALSGFLFGVSYLLAGRDIRRTYWIVLVMFVF